MRRAAFTLPLVACLAACATRLLDPPDAGPTGAAIDLERRDYSPFGFCMPGASETAEWVPDRRDFGFVSVGSTGRATIDLRNLSRNRILVNSVVTNSPTFAVSGAPAFPLALASGASLSLDVTFRPVSAIQYLGQLTVTSDQARNPVACLWGAGQ
jgi:hypothetical protein